MANRDPFKGGSFGALNNVVKNNDFKKQVDNVNTPFKKNKEKTKSVQVRDHVYWVLKRLSFDRKETLVDIVNNVVEDWLRKQPEVKEMNELKDVKKKIEAKQKQNHK